MSTEDLERYEAEIELQLYKEYKDVAPMFSYVVETERRFYLANDVERVELTVDGKYWDKLKKPPFESDWPTSLLTDGNHTIVAKAVYKDKRAVSAKRVVRTRNR